MRKLSRKQAERILEEQYGNISNNPYVTCFCSGIDRRLRQEFQKYWSIISPGNNCYMTRYFRHNWRVEEASILRLLTAHFFIEDCYE